MANKKKFKKKKKYPANIYVYILDNQELDDIAIKYVWRVLVLLEALKVNSK